MNYFKCFIPNYSTKTFPLRQLLHKNTDFVWSADCNTAFDALKQALTSESCVGYFDEKKETTVYTDASPYGVSSILIQNTPNKNDHKIISYSSRALSETEQRYSQIERECLSIVYACEHNRLYLFGRKFVIFNDHKAIVTTLNNPNSKVPLRIERMTLRLQGFTFDLKHIKGECNISDYSSRHPFQATQDRKIEEYVNLVANYSCPNALTLDEIKKETLKDPVLQAIAKLHSNNSWYKLDNVDNHPELKPYHHVLKKYIRIADQLTISPNSDLIMRSNRIILPEAYQRIAIKLAHQGHMGIVKTKALLRSKVYFPDLDRLVEEQVQNCLPCQAVGNPKPPLLQITPSPDEVWHTLNVDYLGPIPDGSYLFVAIDQTSKYPEVEFVQSTSADTLIPRLERLVATFGIPNTVISDNGPPFTSHKLNEFMQHNGINHRRITPRWPQANGEVERFMKPLMKVIRTAHIERKNWKSEVYRFLFTYRNSPHSTTQIPPSQLLFNRKCNFAIPNVNNQVDHRQIHQEARHNDITAKLKRNAYMDNRNHATDRTVDLGDKVIVKQDKFNKLTPRFQVHPYTVTQTKGTMVTARSDINGSTKTRNVSHFKPVPQETHFPFIKQEEEEPDVPPDIQRNPDHLEIPNHNNNQTNIPPVRKQYPKRTHQPAHEWRKY